MNRVALALAAALAASTFAAQAESPDPSGQFANGSTGTLSRAQVATELAQYRKSGVNPWSTSYNPLASFRSEKTRAEVRAEYLADRQAVAAMIGEDSGSAFLAAHRARMHGVNQFAGQSAVETP